MTAPTAVTALMNHGSTRSLDSAEPVPVFCAVPL